MNNISLHRKYDMCKNISDRRFRKIIILLNQRCIEGSSTILKNNMKELISFYDNNDLKVDNIKNYLNTSTTKKLNVDLLLSTTNFNLLDNFISTNIDSIFKPNILNKINSMFKEYLTEQLNYDKEKFITKLIKNKEYIEIIEKTYYNSKYKTINYV